MSIIEYIFQTAADFLWKDWMLVMLLGLGIFYTFVTGFVQFCFFPYTVRYFLKEIRTRKNTGTDPESSGRCSSYQALCTAVASCVGSGNIVGVSTAILAGGPGALFWMWSAALLGMATKCAEITLGVRYHGQDEKGNITGGPMYYISRAFHTQWTGSLVAVLLFIQNAGATLIQSNTISGVVVSIFKGAFSLQAGAGAAAGLTIREAMRYGVARGLYSNEAGEGSGAVIHASAQVDHPVRQGMFGIMEVFIDTILLCSTTGFTVLVTGVTQTHTTASTLAAAAFGSVFPGMQYVIYISLLLFSGTSIMSQWYFGHVSLTYLKKPRGASVYRILFPFLIITGSLSTINMVWSIQDCALGLLILPNVAALILLAPEVRKLVKEFTDPKNNYIK